MIGASVTRRDMQREVEPVAYLIESHYKTVIHFILAATATTVEFATLEMSVLLIHPGLISTSKPLTQPISVSARKSAIVTRTIVGLTPFQPVISLTIRWTLARALTARVLVFGLILESSAFELINFILQSLDLARGLDAAIAARLAL